MLNKTLNNRNKSNVAFFVMCSLFFQIYLVAFLTLNTNAINQPNWLSELLGDKVLVCSEEGFKWVSASAIIAQNNSLLETPKQTHQIVKYQCPLLDAFKFSFVLIALLLISLIIWLERVSTYLPTYFLSFSLQKVYLRFAPKQSPPHFSF